MYHYSGDEKPVHDLNWKHEGKGYFGRRYGGDDNFKIDVKEREARHMNWIYLQQNKVQRCALLNAIVNLLFQRKTKDVFTDCIMELDCHW
jgi:hypothetical protein